MEGPPAPIPPAPDDPAAIAASAAAAAAAAAATAALPPSRSASLSGSRGTFALPDIHPRNPTDASILDFIKYVLFEDPPETAIASTRETFSVQVITGASPVYLVFLRKALQYIGVIPEWGAGHDIRLLMIEVVRGECRQSDTESTAESRGGNIEPTLRPPTANVNAEPDADADSQADAQVDAVAGADAGGNVDCDQRGQLAHQQYLRGMPPRYSEAYATIN